MFGHQKQADEADSDSDWDSIAGDPEPPSDLEATPRLMQPAPPARNSPRNQQNKRHVPLGTSTPSSGSKSNSPAVLEHKKASALVGSQPSQLYGKSGMTSFVDRGHGVTTFSDKGLESKTESPPVDSNSNKVSGNASRRKQNSEGLELNELDFNPAANVNPPYMDFQDALPKPEALSSTKPEQKKGKIKSAYIRNSTPDQPEIPAGRTQGENSWDENEQEEDPGIFHSREQLTVAAPREANDIHVHKTVINTKSKDVELGIGPDIYDAETCCVPYQAAQGTGFKYVFHHGQNHHLNVVPEWREPYMKTVGDRSEKWLKYFWQEFFGALGLVVDFVIIFVLELMRFILRKVLLRFLAGVTIVISDHLLKPYLTTAFNSLIQPIFVFALNTLIGLRNLLQPLLDISREVILQITTLLRGFRLFELNWKPVLTRDVHNTSLQQQRIQEI